MRIGVCVSMFQSDKDFTGLGVLPIVVKAGFDYVEVPSAQLLALGPDELERAVESIQSCGLPALAFNNLFQAGVRLTGPEVDDAKVDAYLDRLLELATRLGIETFIFGSGGARNVPMGFPYEKAWKQVADMLRRLGPRAEKIGVTVVFEHMNRLEGNFGTAFMDGVKMAKEVNLPSVRCLVDSFHLGLGKEPLQDVDDNFDLIRHIHFSNVLERSVATEGRHEQDGLEFLALVKKKNYQHKLSVEGRSANPEKELPEAAAFLRKHLS
jgi:Sugar phosphate isomerases/epimerases